MELYIEKFSDSKDVVILNCIDQLYGHALLKLLNAERHLERHKNYGVVVLIQDFLRWLVPDGVAEIWTVKLPLSRAQHFYPTLHERIEQECRRFSTVSVSKTFSHPQIKDITH